MKAVRIHEYGGPEVMRYEDAPRPEPAPGEVLIRVHAAGTNPVDWKTRAGRGVAGRLTDPFPFITGWDVSGVIEAVGSADLPYQPGDAVYGMLRFPALGSAYAEYVTAPVEHVDSKPSALSHVEAAALPLVALTAWQALFEAAELSADQTILIHAAAGGVGHVAVQLAKWKGATVIGTASGRNADFLRGRGVDQFIDYQTTRFEEVVSGVDAVLDPLAGEIRERSWPVIRPGGVLVSIQGAASEERAAEYGVRLRRVLVRPEADQLRAISGLVEAGDLRPEVSHVLPLADAAQAHELLETGHTRGKIVLKVAD
jgi:NADPH:quinone reductase-like Zn-dependent oxidoreductase